MRAGGRARRIGEWLLGAASRGLGVLLRAFLPHPDLGKRGESVAARYLRRKGFRILARNWRARSGEVDIIALENDTLVFVEVKSRTLADRGDPLWRIDARKAGRIRRAALGYRRRAGRDRRCRIDGVVVEFTPGRRGRPVPAEVRWYPALHSMDEPW